MRDRKTTLLFGLLALGLAGGCAQRQSANPLSPTIAGPIAGVSITVPQPMLPNSGAQVAVDQQPLDLVVNNADSNGVRPLQYVFEISSDAAFGNKLFTQTGVSQGANGHTDLRMPQSLAPEATYYWRAKADDGANASDYSSPSFFRVFTPVIIQAPAIIAPSDGASVSTVQPTLTVANAARSGPAGTIAYAFEVATDAAFSNRVAAAGVPEGGGQTAYTLPSNLSFATRYYWHARAFDPTHVGPYSSIVSFVTPAAPVIVTPAPPSAPSAGSGSANDGINMTQASMYDNDPGVPFWPVTASITSVVFTPSAMLVDFDRRSGSNAWPESDFGVQYTLGLCLNISGRWDCSGVVQFWTGRELESSGIPSEFAQTWFYNSRWGPMQGYQPQPGEQVGVFVGQGNLRGYGVSGLKERSNVVLVPFGGTYQK